MKNLALRISKVFYSVAEILAWIGYIGIAAITLIVLVDVCGRYFFNKPLLGGVEFVELAMIGFGGFAIMYTAVKGGHVAVDLFISRFSTRSKRVMQIITSLLGFATWGWLDYWLYIRALKMSKTMDILRVSNRPFLFLFAVAISLCCLTLLIQTFYPVVSEKKPEEKEP
jgi:TRAP-type C4-dicarboxylate transport system permease small subunit